MTIIYSPVDPVFRIPENDANVDLQFLSERAMSKYGKFEADRTRWMERREEFYLGWDDYISPIRKGLWEGSSNLHLPLTEVQCNQLHARFMQAFFFTYPWFFVDPQEDMDMFRIKKIERLMKYILERYTNFNEGIYNAIDDFSWDLTTDGMGILSRDWVKLHRRATIIEPNQQYKDIQVDLQKLLTDTDEKEFEKAAKALAAKPYVEKSIVRTVFNGPVVRAEDPLYILFAGDVVDCTDLNQQETVQKVCYFTRDELIGFKQSKFFEAEIVDEILSFKPDRKGATVVTSRTNRVESAKDRITGLQTTNSNDTPEKYEFLCSYDRVNPSGKSGKNRLADELIYYTHTASQKTPRWTFLDRVSSTGKRNLHMAHLYRRPRRAIPRGLVETQHSLNEALDMMVNQGLDAGTIQNNPMFLYNKNSTFAPEEFRIEPGIGIPCDDPNTDIRVLDWKVNPNWSLPFQNLVQSFSAQLTSLGPLASGQVGGAIGPMRSTSGVNALLGQTDVNLDVLIKRAKQAVSACFEGLYYDVVYRMSRPLRISVTGAEGVPSLDKDGFPLMDDISPEEARARVHFGLYANSANMNREVQKQNAQLILQGMMQPIALQTGLVGPEQLYEAMLNWHNAMGTIRPERFVAKPPTLKGLSMQAEMSLIMQGIMPPIMLADPEREAKLAKYEEVVDTDASRLEAENGIIHPEAIKILESVIAQHQRFAELTKKPGNIQNPTGSNVSPIFKQGGQNINLGNEAAPEGQPAAPEEEPAPESEVPTE